MAHLLLVIVLFAAIVADTATASPADDNEGTRKKLIEEVTTDQVKRFLDPSRMIHRLPYEFQVSFLPKDAELITHKTRPWSALNNSSAVWVEIPYHVYSIPGVTGRSGIGDISVGWGFLVHENLRKRLTTVAARTCSFTTTETARSLGAPR